MTAEKELLPWECFCDESYYHLWAVREVGEKRWGHCFHVQSKEEAEGLRDLLNTRVVPTPDAIRIASHALERIKEQEILPSHPWEMIATMRAVASEALAALREGGEG